MSHKSSMHEGGESSDRIVPTKCPNKHEGSWAEGVEGRRPAKEIPEPLDRCWTPSQRTSAFQCFGSACGPRTGRAYSSPRWEPCALGARARVCAGGGG